MILAIDPGNTESAYTLIDTHDCRPVEFGKVANDDGEEPMICVLLGLIDDNPSLQVAVEMVASYGMAVGADVFETCVWIGRFVQACRSHFTPVELVYRRDVKLHHCGSSKAKDANITQALIDRFAPNTPNKGKGTKAAPGWFYGFHSDIWQAYALAVLVADRAEGRAS